MHAQTNYFLGVFDPLGVLASFLPGVLPGVDALAFDDDFGVLGTLSSATLFDLAMAGVLLPAALDDFAATGVSSAMRDEAAALFFGDAKRNDLPEPRGAADDRLPELKKEVRRYGGMKEARPNNLYHCGCATTCMFMYCAAVKSELTPRASTVG